MLDNFLIIKKIYLVYIFFVAFFFLVAPSKTPSLYHVIFQIYQATLILIFAYFIFQREEQNKIEFFFGLFLYLIILISSYRFFNINFLGDWLGVGVDGRYYTKIGTDFTMQKFSIFEIFKYFRLKQVMVDDYGMCFITTFFFWFWGVDWGFHLLPYFSIVPILVGGNCLRRLSNMLEMPCQQGYLLTFIWCTMTYSCYNCSVGLKENYMVCFVIIAMYWLQKNVEKITVLRLIMFIFSAAVMLLFRTALFYMLVASLICVILLKIEVFSKYVWLWTACCLLCALPLFTLAINYIGDVRGGVSGQFVNDMYQSKMKTGGFFAPFLNTIVTFVGPIPSFIGDVIKTKYITLFSFTSTIKLLLSFGYVLSIYAVIKERCLKLIPILVFILLHSLMIWVMFYSLHDRYQWPQYPFILLLAFYGFDEYKKLCPKGSLYKYYYFFAIACILFFNFRVL